MSPQGAPARVMTNSNATTTRKNAIRRNTVTTTGSNDAITRSNIMLIYCSFPHEYLDQGVTTPGGDLLAGDFPRPATQNGDN